MMDKKLSYIRFLEDCEKDWRIERTNIWEFQEWMKSLKDYTLEYCSELVEEDEL